MYFTCRFFSPKMFWRTLSNILQNFWPVSLHFTSYKSLQRRPNLIWIFNNSIWLNYLVICLHTLHHFARSGHEHFWHFRKEAMRFRASKIAQWMEIAMFDEYIVKNPKCQVTATFFSREISPVFQRHFAWSVRMFF